MTIYLTRQDLAEWADQESGLLGLIQHGIDLDEFDPADQELREFLVSATDLGEKLLALQSQMYEWMED